jgi:uncharacterized protein (DUF1778 family)
MPDPHHTPILSVRLGPEAREALRVAAAAEEMTPSAFAREAIALRAEMVAISLRQAATEHATTTTPTPEGG